MNYAIKLLLNTKRCLYATMIVPIIGIAAFTGCSHIDGTAGNQPLMKNRVVMYSEQSQEKPEPSDSNPDPGYKWFY
ncbi:MAG: hypothetical protein JOZ08_08580 [Verrucomicrobia bacterium]|nr:hypothetical protein [Verrucomicrobiota bacterium]